MEEISSPVHSSINFEKLLLFFFIEKPSFIDRQSVGIYLKKSGNKLFPDFLYQLPRNIGSITSSRLPLFIPSKRSRLYIKAAIFF